MARMSELERASNCLKVIVDVHGHTYDSGAKSSNFVTVCKLPHWDREGIMIQGSLSDATKFDYDYDDVDNILTYVQGRYPNRIFAVVEVDKRMLSTPLRELWSDATVRGDFFETGMISGNLVVDRSDEAVVEKLMKTTDCVDFLRELNFCNEVVVRPDFLECFEYAINNKGNLTDRDRDVIRGYYVYMFTKSYMARNFGGTMSSINTSLRSSMLRLRRSCGNLFDIGLKEYLKQEEECLKDKDKMCAKPIGELNIDSAMYSLLKKRGYHTIGDIMNAGSRKLLEMGGFGMVSLDRLRLGLLDKGLELGD